MKPFLSGRPQLSASPLQSTASGETGVRVIGHAHKSTETTGAAAPTVECVKQGDRVARIIVTCSCGERIEIECLYPLEG